MGLDGLRGDRSVADWLANAVRAASSDLLGQIEPDLGFSDLGVVDVDSCLLGQEVVGNGDCGGFTGWLLDLFPVSKLTVSSVLLESPTKHGDLLTGNAVDQRTLEASMVNLRVEEGLDDLSRESVLLVLVLNVSIASRESHDSTHHLNNSSPVLGDLG